MLSLYLLHFKKTRMKTLNRQQPSGKRKRESCEKLVNHGREKKPPAIGFGCVMANSVVGLSFFATFLPKLTYKIVTNALKINCNTTKLDSNALKFNFGLKTKT